MENDKNYYAFLIPNVMVLRGGAFGKWLGYKGNSNTHMYVNFERRMRKSLLRVFAMVLQGPPFGDLTIS